jgi:hypothetical protein
LTKEDEIGQTIEKFDAAAAITTSRFISPSAAWLIENTVGEPLFELNVIPAV